MGGGGLSASRSSINYVPHQSILAGKYRLLKGSGGRERGADEKAPRVKVCSVLLFRRIHFVP